MANWTREELNASVKVYIKMQKLEQSGEKFIKKRVYDDLNTKFGRSSKAFKYRMQNISYVYSLLGKGWVKGLKPARNVGSNILPVIEQLILENKSISANLKVEFEEQVSKLRRKKMVTNILPSRPKLPHPT